MVVLPLAPDLCVSERVGVPSALALGGRTTLFLFGVMPRSAAAGITAAATSRLDGAARSPAQPAPHPAPSAPARTASRRPPAPGAPPPVRSRSGPRGAREGAAG